jgi:hypothetical protein
MQNVPMMISAVLRIVMPMSLSLRSFRAARGARSASRRGTTSKRRKPRSMRAAASSSQLRASRSPASKIPEGARSRRSYRPGSRRARRTVLPHLIEVAFPTQALQRLQSPRLLPKPDHQPQPLFHHRSLGRQAGELQGLSHQFVVDFDVGAHSSCRHVYSLKGLYTFKSVGWKGRPSTLPAQDAIARLPPGQPYSSVFHPDRAKIHLS